jgi:hypothetical protein
LALLARQGWRFIQNPSTLSARVLKAVYFPDVEFLHADLGPHPSQVWRAILEGREVLRQGLIRRIGTGQHTNAWDDNWLPRDLNLRPIACPKRDPPQLVSAFIDQANCQWDVTKLNNYFLPMDVQVIQSIPISTRHQHDCWALSSW